MGLFGKSTPPPAPPELPVWLVRNPHDAVENAWVYYQVFRSPRDLVERHGILPWDTLPGVEQTANDFMNRDHRMVEVIGVTAGGKWAEWNLPCPQPPVPGTQPDAPSAPADHHATAVRTGPLLVATHSQDWQLVPKVWDEAGSDENRLDVRQNGSGSVTPKSVKRVSHATHPVSNAVYGAERSLNTTKRQANSSAPVYHHGTCTVNHRSEEVAAKCRRTT
jgi:hypothetical protein